MNTKKTLSRGYNEVYQFVTDISRHILPEYFQDHSIEIGITNFLDSLWKRRFNPRLLFEMMLEFQNKDRELSILCWIISKCPNDKVGKHLEEFLVDVYVPDKIKKKLLLISSHFPIEKKIPTMVSFFLDKETLAEHALDTLLEYMNEGEDNLNQIFTLLLNQELDFYHALTANLTSRSDDASLWLLGMLAEFPNFAIAENAIQALGYRKSNIAYEILENLIHHQNDASGTRTKALARLTQLGYTRSFSRLMSPYKCYLSWIDGAGNRMLLLSRRINQGMGHGRLFMVAFMIHEENGIQDCTIWKDISTYEMENIITDIEKQTGLKQIDYVFGIRIIEDCLWKAIQNKKLICPHFMLARRIFGSQKLLPSKYNINLNDMGIQYIQNQIPELLKASEELLKEHPFCDWCVGNEEILEFAKTHASILNGKKIRKDILAQFIKFFLEPNQEKWRERFLLTAEFLHRTAPRTARRQIEICIAIASSLENHAFDISEIPFMVGLAQGSIQKFAESTEKNG